MILQRDERKCEHLLRAAGGVQRLGKYGGDNSVTGCSCEGQRMTLGDDFKKPPSWKLMGADALYTPRRRKGDKELPVRDK